MKVHPIGYLVGAIVVGTLVLSLVILRREGKPSDHSQQLAAVAASVSAEQAKWNAAHPRPDAGVAAVPRASSSLSYAEQRVALIDELAKPFRGKSLKELQQAVEVECRKESCNDDKLTAIKDCGATDADKAAIQKTIDTEVAAVEKKRATTAAALEVEDRKAFASAYDDLLLKRHMNPDGVSTAGASATTLVVNGWFCSRQFVHDATTGTDGADLRAHSFKRVECSGAGSSYWQDL